MGIILIETCWWYYFRSFEWWHCWQNKISATFACQTANTNWEFWRYCITVDKMGHWAQRRFDKKQELGNKQTWLTSDPPSQINCFHVTLCWVVRTRPKWKCLQLGGCVLLLLHPFTNPSFLSSKYITYCAMQTQDTWYWNSMSKECILHRKMTAVLKLPWALNLACVVIHAKVLPGSVLSIDGLTVFKI